MALAHVSKRPKPTCQRERRRCSHHRSRHDPSVKLVKRRSILEVQVQTGKSTARFSYHQSQFVQDKISNLP
ncbi:hypothetical protein L3X38_044845 [Prunus dulcis]|uniref:Uncharacterized protein n=1 Tax=Prunus dulcis TaxID=3755 RepID=A0AAD4YNS9_PRUDU|nr:hypothetical protein L3X38_044845 [Prunus dulcis]